MSNEMRIGKILDATAERDAVHVAIAPVVAGKGHLPGAHVGINRDGTTTDKKPHVGIIDPFLPRAVKSGERCYLFLYPNTVTSLRHEWTHPAFGAPPFKTAMEALDAFVESERWLRAFAVRNNPYTVDARGEEAAYDDLLQQLRNGELFFHGMDLCGLHDLEGEEDDLEFHAQRVLGVKIHLDKFSFSCSC